MASVNFGMARDFTPSDDVADNDRFNMFMVTDTAGAVAFTTFNNTKDSGGVGDTVVLAQVPIGQWIPCGEAVRINATGTVATGIMVV